MINKYKHMFPKNKDYFLFIHKQSFKLQEKGSRAEA